MSFSSFFKRFDWPLFVPAFCLTLFGLISLWGMAVSSGNFLTFKKQLVFFIVSLALVVVLNFLDLRFLKTNSYFVFSLYILSLLMLGGLFFFGQRIRGVKGWYKFGPVSFDPVPISAIILILILSKYFASRHIEIHRYQLLFWSFLYVVPQAFLVFRQPDLGSAVLFVAVWLGVIIFSGVPLRHFFVLTLIFILLSVAGWMFFLKEYQKQRILSFLNPQFDREGVSWNVNQAKIAVGSGGVFGKGIGKGSQTQHGFLPETETDFIFSAIGEETGLLGISFLLFCFGFLFWRIMRIAILTQSNFSRLFAAGFAFLILSQAFINMGMNLGLVPVVGIPLPFVSYGGSQILGFYLGLGILQNLKNL